MKLIHCADLHLDSPMETNLPPEKTRERRSELLNTFVKMIELAEAAGVAAILIAGDLFDNSHTTRSTEQYVLDLMRSHSSLRFFYLAGNHDRKNRLRTTENKPENLYTFSDEWTSYDLGELVITGSEAPNPETLSLDEHKLNLVLLHGQERSGRQRKDDEISFGKYKGKHIDYLALGHLHEYRTADIDARCTACYAGCPEGRGFDECGPKGYVLLETEKSRITHRFVPLAHRTLHTVPCDVSDCRTQLELEQAARQCLQSIPKKDLVKLVLQGYCLPDVSKDLAHLVAALSQSFYFIKIYDETRLLIRPEDYAHDISLKGEFVRRVMADPKLSDAEKDRVITCGFRALLGEEVGL